MLRLKHLLVSVVVTLGICGFGFVNHQGITPTTTQASSLPSASTLNKQIKAKKKHIKSIQTYLKTLKTKLATAKATLKKTNNSRNKTAVKTLQKKITATNKKLTKVKKQLKTLQNKLKRLNKLNTRRKKAAKIAKSLPAKKIRYRWGGSSLSGMDCSGLTQYVYRKVGVSLIHYTVSQEKQLTYESVGDAKPGDLVFWGKKGASYHVAVYIGNGRYVHAPTSGQKVKVTTISAWRPSFAAHIKY